MVKHKIKKIDLINIISNKTGLSQNLSKKILSDLIEILNNNISNGYLSLKNIGTFKLLSKKERLVETRKQKRTLNIS